MAAAIDLHLGDCLEVMKDIPTGSIDCVVTDPPYGTGEHRRVKGAITKSRQSWDLWSTEWIEAGPCKSLAFFCPPRYLADSLRFAERTLAWVSKNPIALKNVYPRYGIQHIVARGPFAPTYGLDWFYHPSNIATPNHPHEKPLAVMVWIIETMTKPGDTILDPFMGSGTTGVACVQTGRRFIGIELDPGYFAIAQKRIAQAQMQMPLLEVA